MSCQQYWFSCHILFFLCTGPSSDLVELDSSLFQSTVSTEVAQDPITTLPSSVCIDCRWHMMETSRNPLFPMHPNTYMSIYFTCDHPFEWLAELAPTERRGQKYIVPFRPGDFGGGDRFGVVKWSKVGDSSCNQEGQVAVKRRESDHGDWICPKMKDIMVHLSRKTRREDTRGWAQPVMFVGLLSPWYKFGYLSSFFCVS